MINLTVGHSDWFLNEQKTNSSSCVAVGLAYIIVQTIYFLRGQSDGEHHIWSTIDVRCSGREIFNLLINEDLSFKKQFTYAQNGNKMHVIEISTLIQES